MDQPKLTSLIQKYNEAIPGKAGEEKLAKLLYDYRIALEALQEDVASQQVIKAALDAVTGKETQPVTSAEEQHFTLVKHFQSKGREIAGEYIEDRAVIDAIERDWDAKGFFRDEHGSPKITEQLKEQDSKRVEMLRQLNEQQERSEKSRGKDHERD